MPFAVVAAIGSEHDETDHRLLTRAVCELVAMTNEIFSERCTGRGVTGAQSAEAAERAQKWVSDYYQPLLGPSHTTKLHRLAVHLLDEFRLRGTFFDGNTGYNEELRKAVKAAYKATNRRRYQFITQLPVNQQVAASCWSKRSAQSQRAQMQRRQTRGAAADLLVSLGAVLWRS